MSIGSLFSKIGHAIASWFGSHQATIQAVVNDAQAAASAAHGVATALGEPASVTSVISGVSDGLSKIGAAAATAATAEDFNALAADGAALATGLVSSGDLGIKNAATKAAVGALAIKVQGVVGAVETAASAAPPAAS